MILTHLFVILLLFAQTANYQDPTGCEEIYNYLTHSCQACPENTSITSDKTYCNCTFPYYQNIQVIGFNAPTSCIQYAGGQPGQIISLYQQNGQYDPQPITCSDSYLNANKTACIPCGYKMTYSTELKRCVCKDAGAYIINGKCHVALSTPTYSFEAQSLNAQLYEKAKVGCVEQQDRTSCQIIANKCSQENFNSGSFCDLLSQTSSNPSMPPFQVNEAILNESLGIYASSKPDINTTSIKNTLEFIVFQYNSYGQLMDIKPLSKEILPCIATQEDLIKFQSYGLNLAKNCITEDMNIPEEYYYDVFVKNSQGKLFVVPVRYPLDNSNLYRRFTLLRTAQRLDLTFNSKPPLDIPVFNYTNQDSALFSTQSTASTVDLVLLAPFIVFNVGILILFIINFYKFVKYNPNEQDENFMFKRIFLFFMIAIKHWGVGLWIFLFGTTTYIFCFFKFQETVYLMLPDIEAQYLEYYDPFYAVFFVQFSFIMISNFFIIYNISSSTDYFMIDWEKQKDTSNFNIKKGQNKKEISVWRRVLLINELYELTISSIMDLEFITLFSLLFLEGLDWINLSYQIPNTSNLDGEFQPTIINPVLSHFIITFIFFIIGSLQYLLKHLFKVWNPLPYENFVDLCSISNISLIIFDEALHGYYIHGVNPLGQAQGTLDYIDSVFEKQSRSFGKSRAFQNEDPDKIQIFEVIFHPSIRQAFQDRYKTPFQTKLISRGYDPSILEKKLPDLQENDYQQIETMQNDMVESFKYYLEGVKTSQFNVKQRGFFSKIFSCPDEFTDQQRLPYFYKDYWHEFKSILLSGHQFLNLITIINFVNVFFIATSNIFMACFISLFIAVIFRTLTNERMIKKNISKNTLLDDKFFN